MYPRSGHKVTIARSAKKFLCKDITTTLYIYFVDKPTFVLLNRVAAALPEKIKVCKLVFSYFQLFCFSVRESELLHLVSSC